MSTAAYHLKQVEPELDLAWMGDDEGESSAEAPPAETEVPDDPVLAEEWLTKPLEDTPRAVPEPRPREERETAAAPTLHALVQVESGIASVSADDGVNVVVVDWDVIDEEGAEALYVAYEQVRSLNPDVPERDETLEALEGRLETCPAEEVQGLHALTCEIQPEEGPGVLVVVRDGMSSEHADGVEVEWIDWDFVAADEDGSQTRAALTSLTNLPQGFPGREDAQARLTTQRP